MGKNIYREALIAAAVLLILGWLLGVAVSSCRGEWEQHPTPNHVSLISELESRLPRNHPYREPDIVMTGHECTHGVNSYFRNARGGRWNAFYTFGGMVCYLQEPPVRLADVAVAVPYDRRGRHYHLYLIQGQGDWQNQPLYILDELTAYMNGAAVGFEQGLQDRAQDSLQSAREFIVYAKCLCRLLRERQITRPDIEDFVGACEAYLDQLAREFVQ